MAEVLLEYQSRFSSAEGVTHSARVCGGPGDNGLWECWIEFVPVDGGEVVRSPRETTQPNRADAVYWATGLTPVYLEGALQRALNPLVVSTASPPPPPAYTKPAPPYELGTVPARASHSVLDPFSVYEKGEQLLRKQLGAFSAWHLINIIREYDLASSEDAATLNLLSAGALIDLIVAGVRRETKVMARAK